MAHLLIVDAAAPVFILDGVLVLAILTAGPASVLHAVGWPVGARAELWDRLALSAVYAAALAALVGLWRLAARPLAARLATRIVLRPVEMAAGAAKRQLVPGAHAAVGPVARLFSPSRLRLVVSPAPPGELEPLQFWPVSRELRSSIWFELAAAAAILGFFLWSFSVSAAGLFIGLSIPAFAFRRAVRTLAASGVAGARYAVEPGRLLFLSGRRESSIELRGLTVVLIGSPRAPYMRAQLAHAGGRTTILLHREGVEALLLKRSAAPDAPEADAPPPTRSRA